MCRHRFEMSIATLTLAKRGSINRDTLQIGSSVVNGTIIGKIFLIVSCTLQCNGTTRVSEKWFSKQHSPPGFT